MNLIIVQLIDASMKNWPENFINALRINRKIIEFISNNLINHFQIIKCEVSLIKNVNNLNEAARMNTKQQQQHYSKWIRLPLMHGYWAELNGLTTNRKLESESVELKMNEKYMRYLWYYPLCQKIR